MRISCRAPFLRFFKGSLINLQMRAFYIMNYTQIIRCDVLMGVIQNGVKAGRDYFLKIQMDLQSCSEVFKYTQRKP